VPSCQARKGNKILANLKTFVPSPSLDDSPICPFPGLDLAYDFANHPSNTQSKAGKVTLIAWLGFKKFPDVIGMAFAL